LAGCAEDSKPGATPGVTVNETPDMNPKTDHDIDVTPPDFDVDVNQREGKVPDFDFDALEPRDPDTKANQKPGSDPDPQSEPKD
jgi:hypothetical protein